MTKIIEINERKIDSKLISEAAKTICSGGLVAFPTETVYGLGANALDSKSVLKIFEAKKRPADNPLIVHVSDIKMLKEVVREITPIAKKLIKKYWPGPLTLILKKADNIPSVVTCGLENVAVRMPSNKIALELIKKSGVPIAAPSANLSTSPSPTKAEHVLNDLDGRIDIIIDGGSCDIGLESTVLDVSGEVPRLLRPGKISLEELKKFLGKVETKFSSEKPASPGMKYRHYSPRAKVVLASLEEISKRVDEVKLNNKVAVLLFNPLEIKSDFVVSFDGSYEKMAKEIFGLFRYLDDQNFDVIIVESVPEENLGLAIMNRLKKAAGI